MNRTTFRSSASRSTPRARRRAVPARALFAPALLGMASVPAMAAPAAPAAPATSSPATPAATSQAASGAVLASACAGHDGWTDPAPPAHIFGNTWYVGTCGIAAVLVTGDKGHVLIDGGMAAAAPQVLANIAALGFDPREVRWIVSSHEHYDHAGALAPLKRATGARLAALAAAKPTLENGRPEPRDPQFGQLEPMEPVKVDRVLADGDTVTLGTLVLTASATPAHSPGSTSWSWQACDAAFTCRMIAYADSATAISAEGYRFTDHPERTAKVREGLARIAALPCDVLVTPHPQASNLFDRLSGAAPLVDPQACKDYAAAAGARFDARLAKETAR